MQVDEEQQLNEEQQTDEEEEAKDDEQEIEAKKVNEEELNFDNEDAKMHLEIDGFGAVDLVEDDRLDVDL